MQWVYPNLSEQRFKGAMRGAFWLFVATTLGLLAVLMGVKTGMIGVAAAEVTSQLFGPVISINMVVLFYLADQNRRAED